MQAVARRKHSKAEIAAKIVQADELTAQGMPRRKIAQVLGVSAMTLHRWRKARFESISSEFAQCKQEFDPVRSIAELELENIRLRRLVVDLLLENITIEEERARGG
jgi:putative transposase